jgi:hypothetical protein
MDIMNSEEVRERIGRSAHNLAEQRTWGNGRLHMCEVKGALFPLSQIRQWHWHEFLDSTADFPPNPHG